MYYEQIKQEIRKNSILLRKSRVLKDKLIDNQYYPPIGLVLDNIEYSIIKLKFLDEHKKIESKRLHNRRRHEQVYR